MVLGGVDLGAWGGILLTLAGITYCVWYVLHLRRDLAARRASAVVGSTRQRGQGQRPPEAQASQGPPRRVDRSQAL